MRLLRVFRQRARSLFRGAEVDAELENELQYHLEQLTRENIASGMDAAAARLAARRALGGVAQIEEQCRDQRRVSWLTDIGKELLYAWRMLAKSPGFTALAIVTLAFGVGASLAVYALAESLLLRSLPYPSPERLAAIYSVHVKRGEMENIGQEDFRDWQAANSVFERMAFTEFDQRTLTGYGDAERITGKEVSEGFFEMLGVHPLIGRWFTPREQKPGADHVVLLSYEFWVRKFGTRPDVVGGTVFLSGTPFRITGVLPANFRFNEGIVAEYWTPIDYVNYGHQNHQYSGYARLKPGITIQAAQAQMTEIARRMEKQFPDCAGWGVSVRSLRAELLSDVGPALLVFGAAALIMLLVACGNVASLLLARGIGRSKEIAVRIALGAGRFRVARLLLTEGVLLSCLGTAGGIVLAWWLLRLAAAAAPAWMQLDQIVSVSPTVAAFAIVLALGTGVLTGLWPALRGSRANLQSDLKESGIAVLAGRRQVRSLSSLVVMEVALAVVLLTFAGLLTKSFAYLLHTDLGYRTDRLLTFRLSLPSSRYKGDEARLEFWDKLQSRVAALPGTVSVAAADGTPLGGTYSAGPVEVEGHAAARDWTDDSARYAAVTAEYFRTLGISLHAGRAFDAGDSASAEPVAIVNEAFVRRLLPGQNPLGKHVRQSGQSWRRIVGVIGDERYGGPAQSAEPELYAPMTQQVWFGSVAVRTAIPEDGMIGAIRQIVRELDPGLAISQVRTMRQSVDQATQMPRAMMALVTGFALVTLGMSTLGLGGVMAYTVSQRKRELGLRIALGARRIDVARAVIRSAARLVVAGTIIGVACAWVAARVLESLLYGVRPHDPAVILAAPLVLGAIALLACLAPAQRAASVDPMDVLRQE
jgi:putative ABC transport system permease protein